MTCRIAICDDEPADVKYLSALVSKWAAQAGAAVTIDAFPSAEAFLFRWAGDKACDILLLDIELGGMDGVSLAKTVRAEDGAAQIVFITGYSDYIADGYDVEALHYLIKPVKEERLFAVLRRAADRLRRNERALTLPCNGETVRVPLHEIRFLEVQLNYVTVHAREKYVVKKTLGAFESLLDDSFHRAGRSYIVNLRHVARVSKNCVHLKDGAAVPLPRGQYEALNRAIIDHF